MSFAYFANPVQISTRNVTLLRTCVAALVVLASANFGALAQARDAGIVEVQQALTWLGFYDGLPHGRLNNYTKRSIRRYQLSIGARATGQLTNPQRQKLIRRGTSKRKAAGFKIRNDAATGIRIGLPEAWLKQPTPTPWGRNWAAPDNRLDIDTLLFTDGRTLSALYNKLRGISGRTVRYKHFTGDEFFLEGEDRDGRQFYVRATARGNEVRGFSITYERHVKGEAFPAAMAMSGSYQPFASHAITTSSTEISDDALATPQNNQPSTQVQNANNCWNGLGKDCPSILKMH